MAESDVKCSMLVSCDWLREKIQAGNLGNVVILDVSWSSQKECQEEFKQRHIPQARYLNVLMGPHTEFFPRNLPTQEAFQEAARAVGVNRDSHVVVYSDSDNCGFFMSGRAWWTFTIFGAKNVSILNGGLQKWMSLGYETTAEASDWTPGNFEVSYNGNIRLAFEDMSKKLQSKACIVDSRPKTGFSQGHIPGAINLPFTELVDQSTKEMMPADQLKKILAEKGVDTSQPVTTYCNSGMSSSTMAFAFALCGMTDFAVYHGGFTEWKKKARADQIEITKD